MVPSGTKKTPSWNRSVASAASCSERRVLPVPPGPVRVSSRACSSSAAASASSRCAAEEGGQLGRQVVGDRVQRAQRRELVRQALDHEHRQLLRAREVLEPILAELAQAHAIGQRGLRQHPRGGRDQHLAAMAGAGDARHAMHVDADVGLAAERSLAAVDAHPDADRDAAVPRLGRQAALGGDRGRHGAGRGLEDGEDGVALGAEHDPAVRRRPPRASSCVVPIEHRRPAVAQRLGGLGRSLDVGEQEGDGADREMCHARSVDATATPGKRLSHRRRRGGGSARLGP